MIDAYRSVEGTLLLALDGTEYFASQAIHCEHYSRRRHSNGRVTYFHSTLTLDSGNVAEVVEAGRSRWKIENENNNTLKTKGYHFEHNYGHGKQHLSSLLASLIILVFLAHTVLE